MNETCTNFLNPMKSNCSQSQAKKTLINIPGTLKAIQVAKFIPLASGNKLNFEQIRYFCRWNERFKYERTRQEFLWMQVEGWNRSANPFRQCWTRRPRTWEFRCGIFPVFLPPWNFFRNLWTTFSSIHQLQTWIHLSWILLCFHSYTLTARWLNQRIIGSGIRVRQVWCWICGPIRRLDLVLIGKFF